MTRLIRCLFVFAALTPGLASVARAQDIAPELDDTRAALLADARRHRARANGIKVQGRQLFERDFQEIAACEARAARLERAAGLIARAQKGEALSRAEQASLAAALEEHRAPLRIGPLPANKLRLPKPKARASGDGALARLDREIAALEKRAERARLEAEEVALRLELLRVERALIEARRALKKRRKGGE